MRFMQMILDLTIEDSALRISLWKYPLLWELSYVFGVTSIRTSVCYLSSHMQTPATMLVTGAQARHTIVKCTEVVLLTNRVCLVLLCLRVLSNLVSHLGYDKCL